MKVGHLLFSLAALPVSLFGHIAGNYDVHGFDATIGEHYTGTAVISEQDDVYTITWTYTDFPSVVGTGVQKGDSISFVFTSLPQGSAPYGTQLYKIRSHGELKGPWINFGDDRISHETLKKVHCGETVSSS